MLFLLKHYLALLVMWTKIFDTQLNFACYYSGVRNTPLWECSRSTFVKVWKEHFSHVIIPKNHRFTECEICSHLRAILKANPFPSSQSLSDNEKAVKAKEQVINYFIWCRL